MPLPFSFKPCVRLNKEFFFTILGVVILATLPANAVTIAEFSVGITPNSTPYGIAAGPDGNLWFTESNDNKIGRITLAGIVTEFTAGITPTPGGLWGISAGPDGNLWFTEHWADSIGRITPSGVVTEFTAGITTGSGPRGITAGPDGNLWFTESENPGNMIGRITPMGAVTEFKAGITGACLEGITAGPDGNLWFTETDGNMIGRITSAGIVTEFSTGITPGSGLWEITSGPDGDLWFTEIGDKIGQVSRLTIRVPADNSTIQQAINLAVRATQYLLHPGYIPKTLTFSAN